MKRVANLSLHLNPTSTADTNQPPVVYVANRGIIALRVTRTCKQEGFKVVGSFCKSDSAEEFVREWDEARPLGGEEEDGPASYMNISKVIANCLAMNAKFVHPGIGLLSESAEFALACFQAGLVFIGPSVEHLELFGSKLQTCLLAQTLGIPTLSMGVVTKSTLRTVIDQRLPVLLKASNGGGGIGLRIVDHLNDAEEMFDRCQSEAKRAFGGEPDILCEVYLRECRHVEVQLVGDGFGKCFTLSDRECSTQRKFQKVIEIAPCPNLPLEQRQRLHDIALRLGQQVKYRGVGTFEFLLTARGDVYFIECNPRLQVEHTVTEEIFAPTLDLVKVQLDIARGGEHITRLFTEKLFTQRTGFALQCRICAETYSMARGIEPVHPSSVVRALDFPRGAGIRVESICRSGYKPNFRFDSLLAQLIVSSPNASFGVLCGRVLAALNQTRVVGCETNLGLLKAIVSTPRFQTGMVFTQWLDKELMPSLVFQSQVLEFTNQAKLLEPESSLSSLSPASESAGREPFCEENGTLLVSSPMTCTVVQICVQPGDLVVANQTVLFVLSALKMEHEIRSPQSGKVKTLAVQAKDLVGAGTELMRIGELQSVGTSVATTVDTTQLDLTGEQSEYFAQFRKLVEYATLDESRLDKTGKRLAHPTRLTARQIIHQTLDPDCPRIELGRLATNGYQKHAVGDGIYVVKGEINSVGLVVQRPKVLLVAYDYTVLAGTQGLVGHYKKDRAFELALKERHPVLYFAEGGGGRAGDAKKGGFTSTGLDSAAFTLFAKLAVCKVPLVGAVSGFCFAGNAALLGTCDIIVATKNVSLGMGGPAMIEGGGLGVVDAQDVGPVQTHYQLGVVDVLTNTDEEMVILAKQALSYFQGSCSGWKQRTLDETLAAQRILRNIIPTTNRRLAFDVKLLLRNVVDLDSLLELKAGFAINVITCLARLEGKPVGIIANNCRHLGGTLDAYGSAKLAKFLHLCNNHQLPVVSFCDTPGFLVGVESERQGLVKLAGELFVAGAALQVPLISVTVRRCVGLGGQAMCGGSLKVPALTVAWPTAEFAAMGLEGAVRLGFRDELKHQPERFAELLQIAEEGGKAVSVADHFEIDDVIDPADTRQVVINALKFAW